MGAESLRCGPYVLLGEILNGGMASVHFATRAGEGGPLYALKRILPRFGADAAFLRYFAAEVELTLRMDHPNIVHGVDAGVSDDAPYLVMDYIHGRSLSRIIRGLREREKRLPVPHAVFIVVQALQALAHVHSLQGADGAPLKIVLCDISPSNIMVTWDGTAKLIDFGIAMNQLRFVEQIGMLKGKRSYMAPEQLRGLPIDSRIDLYAMAVCLCELLSPTPLFAGLTEFEVGEAVRSANIPLLSRPPKELSPLLLEVLARGLAPDREARFQTAAEFAEALAPFAQTNKGPVDSAGLSRVLRTLFKADAGADDAQLELLRARALAPDAGEVEEVLEDAILVEEPTAATVTVPPPSTPGRKP